MTEKTILGTRNYGYDDIYQLTSAKYERGQAFTWQYDAAGNRLLSDEMGDSKTYVPNNLNQYDSVNGVSYSYDADGNLISDGVRSMGWDIRNRLIQVTKQGKTIKYTYDHNDLRVEKEVDGVKTKYYYDGSLLLCEKDGAGKVQKVYINDGEGIVGMIRYIYNESGIFSHYQRLYYLYDSLGSISVIAGENGLPLQNYTYSPYGSTMNVDYDPVNNLRFVGRYGGYKDDDTGLTYFWHRWYDSINGRWISRDPIREVFKIHLKDCDRIKNYISESIPPDTNAYQYTKNIPINFIDWTGLLIDPGMQPLPGITPTPSSPTATPPRPNPLFSCDNLNQDIYNNCYKECMHIAEIGCGVGGFIADLSLGGLNPAGITAGLLTYFMCTRAMTDVCAAVCKRATK